MKIEPMTSQISATPRNDWTVEEVEALFALPFNDLLFHAQSVHRQNFDPNKVQLSTLLNIKTGGCAEDCNYCSQSAHNGADLKASKMIPTNEVIEAAKAAKDGGATRFCMGAAWSSPKDRDMPEIINMVKSVKSLGMDTCMTLGMLSDEQTAQLKEAGLDYYNHNLDTSREYYDKVVTTRTYDDRLATLDRCRDKGIKLCTGGIIGMGETQKDRASMMVTLANLPKHPESIPINMLIPIEGTPFEAKAKIDHFDFVRTIAVARIVMPASYVRLSAGREEMSEELQSLCFFAGANSMFYGDKLLTAGNQGVSDDQNMFAKLGITPEEHREGKPMLQAV
ncbi:biotin synthase BioB [Terasakiella pusilla]|jgi:biotin synthase|uniref:biotin synthase BioB n=2 Tax=Terasakiella pusilla TaxID=64973 RepID=UPI003AA952BC